MVKRVSSDKLEAVGGRVLEPKPAVAAKPVKKGPSKEQRMIEKAVVRIDAAEAEARKAVDIAAANLNIMQQLIDKMPPPQPGIPIITGFKFIRDNNDIATGVEFIRDKRVVN